MVQNGRVKVVEAHVERSFSVGLEKCFETFSGVDTSTAEEARKASQWKTL